jgi:insertion element IS1 protein InsB
MGAYERHIAPAQHAVGKQHTQKIESKPINLRTRIKRVVRRTMCFAKTERLHDRVIGLCVNRYEFERLIEHALHSSETPSRNGGG